MKICLAQIKSEKGNIKKNISNHLKFIESAIKLNAERSLINQLGADCERMLIYNTELKNTVIAEVI